MAEAKQNIESAESRRSVAPDSSLTEVTLQYPENLPSVSRTSHSLGSREQKRKQFWYIAAAAVLLGVYLIVILAESRNLGRELLVGTEQNSSMPTFTVLTAKLKSIHSKLKSAASSKDWSALEDTPKIYVYDLPDRQAKCHVEMQADWWKFFIYGAEITLETWLRGSPYVTSNPEEADFFYVPAKFYCALGPYPPHDAFDRFSKEVYDYLETNSPYWQRSGGTDHIFAMTEDHGFCGYDTNHGTSPYLQDSIILSHWGLKTPEIGCEWAERLHTFGHCLVRELSDVLLPPGTALPCYAPGKDVVIPSSAMDDWVWTPQDFRQRVVPVSAPDNWDGDPFVFTYRQVMLQVILDWAKTYNLEVDFDAAALKKSTILYFNGDVRENDLSYSHGVRQTVYALFREREGYRIWNSKAGPEVGGRGGVSLNQAMVEMAESTFCLCVSGAGWGLRLKLAVMAGCIPVVITDKTDVEYEEILPYQDFAIRIPPHAVYRLPDILDMVINEPGRVLSMQRRLNCAWRYFSYHAEYGRMGEGLICALRQRLFGYDEIVPVMDWNTCTLNCGSVSKLDLGRILSLPPTLSVSTYGQRLYRLVGQTDAQKLQGVQAFGR